MFELTEGLVLYHGSYCEVSDPNLDKCAKRKDFGRGFYLTSSRQQAERFLKTSIAKASSGGIIESGRNYGFVSSFQVTSIDKLDIHVFKEADIEWLHCVAAHRKRNTFVEIENKMENYDVIVGKIADDATNATLTAYMAGAFGDIGSAAADNFCINQLLPNKLKDQYCFKTVRALKCLKYKGCDKVWMNR